ncbi:MAG: hypothetical protein ACI8QZ_001694 [Chlamydiales bacterium]|jgi:hypothetical protein
MSTCQTLIDDTLELLLQGTYLPTDLGDEPGASCDS